MPVTPAYSIVETTGESGVGGTFILQEVEVLELLEVDIAGGHFALLIDYLGNTLIVQSDERNGEECTVRITYASKTAGGNKVDDTALREEVGDFGLAVGNGEVGVPVPVFALDVMGREGSFETL